VGLLSEACHGNDVQAVIVVLKGEVWAARFLAMVKAAGVGPTVAVAWPVAEPAVAVITGVPFATAVASPFGSTVTTAVSELDQLAITCCRVLPPYDPATLSYAASWRVPPGAAMAEDWVP